MSTVCTVYATHLPSGETCGSSTRAIPIIASNVNGALALAGAAEPHALLGALHGIEGEAGRERTERWGPRTLDLDLVAVDDLVVANATLTLPHPRMHERAFVLLPVCDVAPGWRHPVLGLTAKALLCGCADAGAAKALPGAAAVLM